MKLIADYSILQLREELKNFAEPSFRAEQIFKWVNNGAKFSEMTDIPKKLVEKLENKFIDCGVEFYDKKESKDGSIKFLLKLFDNQIIECVYLPNAYGNTVCVSTQVGCAMGCAFCASTIGGLIRNLTSGEILSQVIFINKYFGGSINKRTISNIVLMGSGEPLANYENVTTFIKNACDVKGLNFSMRSISLSSCGLADKIKKLADDGFSVTFSLSMHATTDEVRRTIMPIANSVTLKELKEALKYYFDKTKRRVVLEYAMIKDVNMNYFDAKRISEFCKDFSCHVNLINLNKVEESSLQPCTKEQAERFLKQLTDFNVSATIRRSYGQDIYGACGQLRRKVVDLKK